MLGEHSDLIEHLISLLAHRAISATLLNLKKKLTINKDNERTKKCQSKNDLFR